MLPKSGAAEESPTARQLKAQELKLLQCQDFPTYTVWALPLCSQDASQQYMYTQIYMYVHRCIYLHAFMGNGISPPAFCDISKSHELKQFRVKGLGYMSLGFRLPNFPISQIVLAHLGWCLLGNWETGKYVPATISQFPK